ncbi:MAG: ABC transporter ATP-binding protein [Alphaproteobacteria bacterium]
MTHTPPLLDMRAVSRWYGEGPARVTVLKDMDFTLNAGESVAIVGPSGCGKSTLLHMAGLLDKPNTGEVWVNGVRADTLPDGQQARIRNATMGFVYQHHHLLREFTAVENVGMPARIGTGLLDDRMTGLQERPEELLGAVGLGHRLEHYPSQLSGGEQQRVAIARALMNRPALLLADEPTGNLDPHTAESVTDLLFHLINTEGMAALIVTHNMELAKRCSRVVRMG